MAPRDDIAEKITPAISSIHEKWGAEINRQERN
jgi:hypothetical protein